MKSLTKQQQATINQVYDYAAALMFEEEKNADEVKRILSNKGIDQESTTIIISYLEDEIKRSKRERAYKNMLYGALCCIAGLIATLFNIGLIFYGLIIFGAIQLIIGLYAYFN